MNHLLLDIEALSSNWSTSTQGTMPSQRKLRPKHPLARASRWVEALPSIIAESVKPMENIEGIKILHVDGLSGGGSHGHGLNGHGGAGIADQAVDAALRYRSQAPLIDALLAELGLKGGSLNGLVSSAVAPALDIDEEDDETGVPAT